MGKQRQVKQKKQHRIRAYRLRELWMKDNQGANFRFYKLIDYVAYRLWLENGATNLDNTLKSNTLLCEQTLRKCFEVYKKHNAEFVTWNDFPFLNASVFLGLMYTWFRTKVDKQFVSTFLKKKEYEGILVHTPHFYSTNPNTKEYFIKWRLNDKHLAVKTIWQEGK